MIQNSKNEFVWDESSDSLCNHEDCDKRVVPPWIGSRQPQHLFLQLILYQPKRIQELKSWEQSRSLRIIMNYSHITDEHQKSRISSRYAWITCNPLKPQALMPSHHSSASVRKPPKYYIDRDVWRCMERECLI